MATKTGKNTHINKHFSIDFKVAADVFGQNQMAGSDLEKKKTKKKI